MTRDSNPHRANAMRAICTNMSGPWNGGQRPPLSHDGFDHLERFGLVILQALLAVCRRASTRARKRTERAPVGRPAADWIVGTTRPRDRRELCLNSHRFGEERDF